MKDKDMIVNQIKLLLNQLGKMGNPQENMLNKEYNIITGWTLALEWVLKE